MTYEQRYYDFTEIRSRNCIWNFIHSARSAGKTTQWKLDVALHDWFKYGRKFYYIRGTEKDLQDDWCDHGKLARINPKYKDITATKKSVFYTNPKTREKIEIGRIRTIYQLVGFKSSNAEEFKNIAFDEYNTPHIWNVPTTTRSITILEFMTTVSRGSEGFHFYFLGNMLALDNEYLRTFNIELNPDQEWQQRGHEICIHTVPKGKYAMPESSFTRSIAGTKYGNYALDNKPLTGNDDFIEPRPKQTKLFLRATYFDDILAFYVSNENDLIYIQFTRKINDDVQLVAANKGKGVSPKYLSQGSRLLLENAAKNDNIRYTARAVKSISLIVLKRLGII